MGDLFDIGGVFGRFWRIRGEMGVFWGVLVVRIGLGDIDQEDVA